MSLLFLLYDEESEARTVRELHEVERASKLQAKTEMEICPIFKETQKIQGIYDISYFGHRQILGVNTVTSSWISSGD